MVRSIDSALLNVETAKPKSAGDGGGGFFFLSDTCENHAWTNDIFAEDEIDAIVEMGSSVTLQHAYTLGGHLKAQDPAFRNSSIAWLYPNEITMWVFERLAAATMMANQQYFHLDLTAMVQGLQFTEYREPGDHYSWHVDRVPVGAPRKLSITVQLSDGDEYEGGDLEIWAGTEEPIKAHRGKGSTSFFPSWTMHRVTPVTKGVRRSLVCWVSGPPFK